MRREHVDWMTPDRFGHGQVEKTLPELRDDARKIEYATSAYAAVAAMDAGLALLEEIGLARIEAHTVALAAELRDGALKLGFDVFTPPENASSIVSFHHGMDPERLREHLEKENVAVTLREEGALLRAGIAMLNNREDVARLLEVLSKLV